MPEKLVGDRRTFDTGLRGSLPLSFAAKKQVAPLTRLCMIISACTNFVLFSPSNVPSPQRHAFRGREPELVLAPSHVSLQFRLCVNCGGGKQTRDRENTLNPFHDGVL